MSGSETKWNCVVPIWWPHEREPSEKEKADHIKKAISVVSRHFPDGTGFDVTSYDIGAVSWEVSSVMTYGDCDDPDCTDPEAHKPVLAPARSIRVGLDFESQNGCVAPRAFGRWAR